MRVYDLQATQQNVKQTFITNAIDRNSDITRFCSILDSINGSCSIALDGKWGSGKTFFVKQAKMLLDVFNNSICNPAEESDREKIRQLATNHRTVKASEYTLQPQVAIYYDAWANDNDEDPILSLIYVIIQSSDTYFQVEKKRDILKIIGCIGDFFTGKKVSSFLEAIKGDDPLSLIKRGKSIHELMAEFFDELLLEHDNRLVIFIDELDRCKPSFAVQLLERMKHYCGDERVTFVYSINTEQLQHTIKRYYGEEFNASRYLDRFFDLRLSLPQANMQKFYQSIAFNDSMHIYDKMCRTVIENYQFELREIAKFVHLSKIAAYKPTHNRGYDFSFSDGQALLYALHYFIPIMIGLRIHDESAYAKFVSGKDISPLMDIFRRDTNDYFHRSILLNRNETYDNKNPENGVVVVTAESKIEEVYHALFINDYSGSSYAQIVGNLEFSAETKSIIMRTASLLSDFADYTY